MSRFTLLKKSHAQRVLMAIALVCFGSIAKSHELPMNLAYPNQSVAVAASYSLTGNEITTIYQQSGQYFDFASWTDEALISNTSMRESSDVCNEITSARTCGQVDDFYKAATAAIHTCNSFAILQKTQFSGHLVPRFTQPSSFVTGLTAADGHHANYHLAQGIVFDCVYPIADATEHTEQRTR